jgi:2-polyprenyl-3-methyl-5-hydroxy-6-metoxy-1,4-benzoquinol methylase
VFGNDACAITEQSSQQLGLTISNEPIENFQTDRKFDLIMSFHVMEHLVDTDRILDRLCKFSKCGGKIFLHIPIDDNELTNPDHYHFFSPLSMTYLMSKYTDIMKFDIQYYRCSNGDLSAVGSILGRVKER